jgi:tetratricopeptide (TPR) repeat protein
MPPRIVRSGAFTRFTLPSLLIEIRSTGTTGTLRLDRPGESRYFFFEGGNLRLAASSREEEKTGRFLVRNGLLAEDDLARFLAPGSGGPRLRFGRRLVAEGRLDSGLLAEQLVQLSRHIVLSTFAWEEEGSFELTETDASLDPEVALDLSLPALLVEGLRALPESEEFVLLLGDLDARPVPQGESPSQDRHLILLPDEALLLWRCDGTASLLDMLRMGVSRRLTARALYGFLGAGFIRLEPPVRRERPERPTDSPAAVVSTTQEEVSPGAQQEMARQNYVEARRLLEGKDYFGAIRYLRESVRMHPDKSEYHFRLGSALSRNPRWGDEADFHFKKALALDPSRIESMAEYVDFLLRVGRSEEARPLAQQLVTRYPHEKHFAEFLSRAGGPILEDDLPSGEKGSLLSRFFKKS